MTEVETEVETEVSICPRSTESEAGRPRTGTPDLGLASGLASVCVHDLGLASGLASVYDIHDLGLASGSASVID